MTDSNQKPRNLLKNYESFIPGWIIVSLILSMLIVLWLLIMICLKHIDFASDLDFNKLSAIGDFIGGIVGTLFALIAVFLIWLTYNQQREELRSTNNQLAAQSQHMATQFEIMEKSFQYNTLSKFWEDKSLLAYEKDIIESIMTSLKSELFTSEKFAHLLRPNLTALFLAGSINHQGKITETRSDALSHSDIKILNTGGAVFIDEIINQPELTEPEAFRFNTKSSVSILLAKDRYNYLLLQFRFYPSKEYSIDFSFHLSSAVVPQYKWRQTVKFTCANGEARFDFGEIEHV